jgi:uncharacterized protein (UPF0332 family)
MIQNKNELINYRLQRSRESYSDAELLANNGRWNSAINRLYYAAYYAATALLLKNDLTPTTHNGAKLKLSEYFIKPGIISRDTGKMYSQLFGWRQKGDYDELFDFTEEKVVVYFEPVKSFIDLIETLLAENNTSTQSLR